MIETISARLLKTLKPKANSYDVRDKSIKGFMVRVFPSGKMTYRCEYGRGKRLTIGDAHVLSVAQARERAKQILGDSARGLDPKAAKESRKYGNKIIGFKQFFEAEYKPWLQSNNPDAFKKTAQRLENRFMKAVGHLPLIDITPHVLEQWRRKRLSKDGVSRNTANKEIVMLKAVLNRARKWGFIKVNPLDGFEMGETPDNTRVRYLDKSEYARLMEALEIYEEEIRVKRDNGNAWREMRDLPLLPDLRQVPFASSLKPKVLLSLGSGIRKSELKRLVRNQHLDYANKSLLLTANITKAKKSRHIPLDDATWDMLVAWINQTSTQFSESCLVFPGKDGHTQFDNVTKSWKKLLALAEIENFRWHDMRHDYASQLVMANVDLNTVRELLGHADLKMTLRYAHLAPEHKKQAVKSLQNRRKAILKDHT